MYIRHGVKIAKNLQVKIKKEGKISLIIYNLISDLSKLQGDSKVQPPDPNFAPERGRMNCVVKLTFSVE